MEQQEARHKQEMSTAQAEAQLQAKREEAELQLYVKRKQEEQTVSFLKVGEPGGDGGEKEGSSNLESPRRSFVTCGVPRMAAPPLP